MCLNSRSLLDVFSTTGASVLNPIVAPVFLLVLLLKDFEGSVLLKRSVTMRVSDCLFFVFFLTHIPITLLFDVQVLTLLSYLWL